MGVEKVSRGTVLDGVLTGVFTMVWYAMPDVVRSRRNRGLLKSGLVVGTFVGAVGHAVARRGTPAEAPDTEQTDVADPSDIDTTDDVPMSMPRATAVAALGLGLAAAAVAGSVAIERALFRWSERRRAAGVRGAHTRTAAVLTLGAVVLGGGLTDKLSERAARAAG